MYLKSLEIHGFKSFANKLIFDFKGGITGIVGPNGSGKSNVGDAVRWVLGEQSAKQLRGAKMEDIIFSGTQTRKPLGFAYVAITLDNSDHQLSIDFDEVTIARRVYRSGESEYLINGTNCRLKDVQELFLDTGIGKEGYSIIGQGQIDKILSGKPEDRRELFDEAAGIVKFKKRKVAAEKNLDEEKQNLCRINDILSEIEKQVEPLEKQSLVAKEYLKYREELKELDVNMFLIEYERIHDEQKDIDSKIDIASVDLGKAKENFDQTKEEYDKLEAQIEQFNATLEEKRVILNNYRLHKEKLEGDIKVLQEQIAASNQSKTHYQERIHSVEEEMGTKGTQLKEYQGMKQEIDDKLDSIDDVQTQASDELDTILREVSDITKAIEDCNNDILRYLNENSNVKSELKKYETILEQNNIQKVTLNQKLLKCKSDEAILAYQLKEQLSARENVKDEIAQITTTNQNLEMQIREVQSCIKDNEEKLRNLQQKFHQEKSKLDSLKNMTERYDGYGNSIRKIMELKPSKPGIEGVVADIIKVKKEYETAVEIALGGSIQNIVTDNENTAKELIDYLKRNKFGRATFLPLTTVTNRGGFKDKGILKEQGVIGLAHTLVENDVKYNGLVEYLLGRIVVVDHIDHAISLAKKYSHTLRIVTVEGESLSPGGSMSGGSYKNSSNLLSRRREMEEIEATLQSVEGQLAQVTQSIEKDKISRNEHRSAYEGNKNSLQELSLSQNTMGMQIRQLESKQSEILNFYEEIKKESNDYDLQAQTIRSKVQELNTACEGNQTRSKACESRIEEYNRLLEEKKDQEKLANEKASTLKMDFSALEQRNLYALENIKRLKQDLEKLQEELLGLNTNLEVTNEQILKKKEVAENTKEQVDSDQLQIVGLDKEIAKMIDQKEELTRDHKSFFQKREELSRFVNDLDKETFRLASQRDKLLEQLDSIVNYMWQEYEMTYSMALAKRNEEYTNISQMRKLIQELKAKIKSLGDVNVNAIEDYKNLMDRYELFRTQHDDLIEAEEALKEIIAELDTEMRKQFEEKFAEIKSQFDLVFKELFGGGKGTLELMEDEDILEAGVRIIAQPPGKKLQNMMQLSGGEKALTAISLLFAIQNLKPSPFCLLDEIEAALDDANVKRYAKYLHKLTKHTQFIVITHRRGTMAAADTLYGITMQEKGVSTLVSVNLIEDELEDSNRVDH